jgi:hypothetical protein
VVPEDEQHEKVAHQVRFLSDQGLTSEEMDDWTRQLWLLERLAGKDPSKLDPRLRDRIQGEIARAAMDQLKATELVDAWLEAWEKRHEVLAPVADPVTEPELAPSQSEPVSSMSSLEIGAPRTLP